MRPALSLKPGDVVEYEFETYVVESQTTYSSAALSWTEWVLNPGAQDRRVTVVAPPNRLYAGRPCWVTGNPGDRTVEAEGRAFTLTRTGRVDGRTVYEGGAARFDRTEFWHYSGGNQELLEICRSHAGEWALLLAPTDPDNLDVFGV